MFKMFTAILIFPKASRLSNNTGDSRINKKAAHECGFFFEVFMASTLRSFPGTKTVTIESSLIKCRRVLGIDPGLASTGWGILDYENNKYRLIQYGVIETQSTDLYGSRLEYIFDTLTQIISMYKPCEAGMETLYFAKNVSSAMAVAEARGVITLCLSKNNILLGEYTPLVIKQSVTGNAKAGKTLIQDYLKILLGLQDSIKPDHASDAVAAAITHIHSYIPDTKTK